MKKQKTLLIITLALALSFIITGTVHATPQKMSDGVTFDPQYYAETYPDVVNVYGKCAGKLYQHYVEYGKSEGRKATADSKVEKDALTTLKEQYPNGTAWDTNALYEIPDMRYDDGFGKKNTGSRCYGSLGWAWKVYDTINGLDENNIWKYHFIVNHDVNTVKAGDVVWLDKYGLIVAYVLNVDKENRSLIASKGDHGGKISWDLQYNFDNIYEVWYMEKDKKGQKDLGWIIDGVETY